MRKFIPFLIFVVITSLLLCRQTTYSQTAIKLYEKGLCAKGRIFYKEGDIDHTTPAVSEFMSQKVD